MSGTEPFAGLTMPVFTAFGWAGEATALKYAVAQLELFIHALHHGISMDAQQYFPVCGLDAKTNSVYLATHNTPEDGAFIAFTARPMSMNMTFSVVNRQLLAKGYETAQAKPIDWHRQITELGNAWSVHFQQQQVDGETGEISHYTDLFKDSVTAFDPNTSDSTTSRAVFLNGDPRWVIPFHLSRRYPSEQIAAMGLSAVGVLAGEINRILPLVDYFESRLAGRKTTRRKPRVTKTVTAVVSTPTAVSETTQPESNTAVVVVDETSFTYTATLKPLHLRKGFINLTEQHWPFFALNTRAGSRPVTIYFDGRYDKEATVWRLQPDNQARLVLGHTTHNWLEKTFQPEEQIEIKAFKSTEGDIQIRLARADSQ
jgi:hypothetical protein